MKISTLISISFSIANVQSLPLLSYDLDHAKDAPQTCDIKSRVQYVDLALERTFRKHKGVIGNHNYWSNAGWINYNVMESILNAMAMYPEDTVDNDNFSLRTHFTDGGVLNDVVENLWKENFGKFGTDDYGWKALFALAAWRYQVSRGDNEDSTKTWLKRAQDTFDQQLATMWDDSANGGGIFWKQKGKFFRSTISTELYFTLAAQLHNAGVEGNYLDQAKKAWNFLSGFPGLRTNTSLFYDGFHEGGNIDHGWYTYNQGVVLSGLGHLYNATQNATYVEEGVTIARAMYGDGGFTEGLIIADKCDRETIDALKDKNAGKNVKITYCDRDPSYFKGAFMKHFTYFLDLIPLNDSMPFRDFVQSNSNAAWSAALNDSKDGFSNIWIGTDVPGFFDLKHKNIGESTGMVFDAVVAGIKNGNKHGC